MTTEVPGTALASLQSPHSEGMVHVSVLPAEVLEYLAPQPGATLVDATLGAGGHSRMLAQAVGKEGRVFSLDHDLKMIERTRPSFSSLPGLNIEAIHARFDLLPEILASRNIGPVDGILADLGICSDQLDHGERGFSFNQSGPLDMRMDQSRGQTAADMVNQLSEYDLANLIFKYGEERFSRRIARYIVQRRTEAPFQMSADLAQVVRRAIPRRDPGGIDPATRTFQALRIAVNDELAVLERFLSRLELCLKPGGRAVIISFHSLEDRLVKTAFRQAEKWEILTKKPVMAGEAETQANPRSRSARLRAARTIDPSAPEIKKKGKYR